MKEVFTLFLSWQQYSCAVLKYCSFIMEILVGIFSVAPSLWRRGILCHLPWNSLRTAVQVIEPAAGSQLRLLGHIRGNSQCFQWPLLSILQLYLDTCLSQRQYVFLTIFYVLWLNPFKMVVIEQTWGYSDVPPWLSWLTLYTECLNCMWYPCGPCLLTVFLIV